MIIYSKITEYPNSEPVTLTEAKAQLEYSGTAKNTFIESLITTARQVCEAYAGLSFVTQERRIKLDRFPCGGSTLKRDFSSGIVIPYGPVQSIDSITYTDTNGDEQTLVEGTDFIADIDSDLGRVYAIDSSGDVTAWPSAKNIPNAVVINYTAGFDDVSGVHLPAIAKQAILLQVASMFENRQDEVIGTTATIATRISMDSKALLDNIKVTWNANAY